MGAINIGSFLIAYSIGCVLTAEYLTPDQVRIHPVACVTLIIVEIICAGTIFFTAVTKYTETALELQYKSIYY